MAISHRFKSIKANRTAPYAPSPKISPKSKSAVVIFLGPPESAGEADEDDSAISRRGRTCREN